MKPKRLTKQTRRLAVAVALALVGFAAYQRQAYAPIVGYLNVNLTNGYNFVADPLDYDGTGTNNTLNNTLSYEGEETVPSGSKVYVWDVTNQVFLPPSTFSITTSNWNPNYNVPLGKGFVIWSNTNSYILTLVGQLLEGTLINFVAGSNKFSLLASRVPVSGSLGGTNSAGSLGFPGADGDDCLLFDTPSQSYMAACTYFEGFGWFDPTGAAGTNGPTINVGQSFFLQNPGPDTNWVVNFTVQFAGLAQQKSLTSSSSAAPGIGRMRVSAGIVTLEVLSPSGGAYNVQYSTDGLTWTTVASNQTGAVWTGKQPGDARGYYQVVNP